MIKQQDLENAARKLQSVEEQYNQYSHQINQFVNGYEEIYSRKPQEDEIRVNFKEQIDEMSMKRYISSYSR